MIDDLRIPRERVRVLRESAALIEKSTSTSISISRDGDVHIDGEPMACMSASNICKAVGRGFSYRQSSALLEEDVQLVVIPVAGTEKTIKRLMSRVIGSNGMAKKIIERYSGADICIYGKTVSIIGSPESANLAMHAVEDLLAGRKHAYVFKKLEKMKRLS